MTEFRAKRITHEYTQTNVAPPNKVFLLLCPVREADWVPGWQYRLIYSRSGVAEKDCVFTTPNEVGSETIWVVTEYDPATLLIGFVWVNPGQVAAQIQIQLKEKPGGQALAHVKYVYTGLSSAGNEQVDRYDEAWFRRKMQSWEAAINHYLRTGKRIEGGAWE